jgi:hypothetical protein
MERLKLRLVAREDWAKYFDEGSGTIFCPSATPPPVGQSVELEVLFQGGPRMILRGDVLWRRPAGDARTRPGIGFGVHPIDQLKMTYLLGYVRGESSEQRGRRRLPIRMRVTYSARAGRRINFTRDIHEDGVFVRSVELLDMNAETKLLLAPPGGDWKPIEVRGKVARLVEEGPDRGMGIQLVFRGEVERRAFAEFVERLEEQYLAGTLPDEALG